MNTSVIVWIIAAAVVLFHFWASRRSPKYWFLGGIVPLVWLILMGVFLARGELDLQTHWRTVLFPPVVLILVWIQGQQAARRRDQESAQGRHL